MSKKRSKRHDETPAREAAPPILRRVMLPARAPAELAAGATLAWEIGPTTLACAPDRLMLRVDPPEAAAGLVVVAVRVGAASLLRDPGHWRAVLFSAEAGPGDAPAFADLTLPVGSRITVTLHNGGREAAQVTGLIVGPAR